MPELEQSVWNEYAQQGVVVYGIHQDEPADQLADFVEQTGITFPVIADEGTLSKLDFPIGVGYPYPRDVVVGKDLKIHAIKNSFDVTEMNTLIQKLLEE